MTGFFQAAVRMCGVARLLEASAKAILGRLASRRLASDSRHPPGEQNRLRAPIERPASSVHKTMTRFVEVGKPVFDDGDVFVVRARNRGR